MVTHSSRTLWPRLQSSAPRSLAHLALCSALCSPCARCAFAPTNPSSVLARSHDTDTAELYLHFAPACHFIHSALAAGHAALIHCQQGISRSAAIATAYLIRHHDQSLRDAYVQVKASRPAVKVSANFLRQLMRWERQCRDEPKQAAQRKSSTAQQAETAKSQPEPAVQMEYAVETNKRKRATEAESVQAEQAAERESSEAKETEKTRDADTDGVAASADVAKREQGVSSGKRQKVAELSLLNLQHEHQPKPTTQRLLERSTHTSDGV